MTEMMKWLQLQVQKPQPNKQVQHQHVVLIIGILQILAYHRFFG